MDEFSINFGRHRIMGCPWHGLVRGSRLTLPNGQHKDGQWFATTVRGSYRVAVPGVAPIARTAEEAAYDAEQGHQWRTDAVINLWSNDAALMLYGRKNIQASTLYAEAVGNCWAVALPSNMAVNAGKTQLQQPAVFGRFGALSFAPVEDERPVTVTLAGYDPADPQDRPNPSGRTWDSLPDGSQTILGGAGYGATHDLYVPTAAFDLLRVSGKGTPESPFAAVLEKLSSAASGSVTQTDTFQTWSGVTDWVPQITEEWIAPLDSESGGCEWLKVTVSGSTLELDPDGIPSAVTPALTYTSGVREAKLLTEWYCPAQGLSVDGPGYITAWEKVLAEMLPRVEPMYAQLLDALEPSEREEFLRLLRKFVHLNTPAPEDDADMPDQPSDSA